MTVSDTSSQLKAKLDLLSPELLKTISDFVDFLLQRQNAPSKLALPKPEQSTDTQATFEPRSALGKKPYAIRQQAIREGAVLATAEDIETEIAAQRRYHSFDEDLS
ncbi:MAG: hypothetical protein AAF766_18790 [Cyanobacteria bacterium P01_D01_bin.14]